jgi:hypothetical protein
MRSPAGKKTLALKQQRRMTACCAQLRDVLQLTPKKKTPKNGARSTQKTKKLPTGG